MEKVWECGLMWSRDEEIQERKVGVDGRCVHARKAIVEGMKATGDRILDSERRADTRQRGRATARRGSCQ